MNQHQRRIAAFAMVAVMLAVPMTVVTFNDSDDSEVDGNPLVTVGVQAVKFVAKHWKEILSLVTGFIFGWELNDALEPEETVEEQQLRKDEALAVANALISGTTSIANAFQIYANIWGLTQEHWTRQAELVLSTYWVPNSQYSPYDTLTLSSTYYNSALMLVNATNQINELLSTIAEHVDSWNASDVSQYYGDGKMQIRVSIGNTSVSASSSDTFSAVLGSIVGSGNDRTVHTGSTAVYYVGGPVWASAPATMTGANGMVFNLKEGWNYITDVDGWDGYNVYRLTPGVTYFGNFMYVLESDAAQTQVGMLVSNGDDTMIVSCNGTNLYDGSKTYKATGSSGFDCLKLSVVPQNEDDIQTMDITAMLVYYAQLNSEINRVISEANQNARVVWSCYDDAGSASQYLTTLTVPDTYENVKLTDAQKKLLVTLSMDQLYTWWDENNHEIKYDDYRLTQDSMTLYCRGDLTIRGVGTDGNLNCTIYEDVAYTPVFYRSTTLHTGQNTLDTYCFVLVYGDCKSLSGFDAVDYDDCELLYLGSGSVLGIAEMRYGGDSVQSVDLVATEVEYIDAQDMMNWDPVTPVDGDGNLGELIRLILVVIGAGLLLYGVSRGSWIWVGVGVAVLVVGFVFADDIGDFLYEWKKWSWMWPF